MFNLLKQNKIVRALGSLNLTVLCLILFAVLVVAGTFYQVDHGIYAAQERFFKAWVTFVFGFLPLPGVRLVMLILAINLILSAFTRIPIAIRAAGLWLTHAGIAILIAGGAIASYDTQESTLTLAEGQTSSISNDFQSWEFAAGTTPSAQDGSVVPLNTHDVRGSTVEFAQPALKIKIAEFYRNSRIVSKRDGVSANSVPIIDSIEALGSVSEGSSAIPGAIVQVEQGNGCVDSKVNLYGGLTVGQPIACEGETLWVHLRPKQISLPIQITLLSFRKDDHPGTSMARSYESRVHVTGDGIDRDVLISMNRPFRYRHLTFYQASYSESDGHSYSSLSISAGHFKKLPYVSGTIISIGLLLHLLTLIPSIRKRTSLTTKE